LGKKRRKTQLICWVLQVFTTTWGGENPVDSLGRRKALRGRYSKATHGKKRGKRTPIKLLPGDRPLKGERGREKHHDLRNSAKLTMCRISGGGKKKRKTLRKHRENQGKGD